MRTIYIIAEVTKFVGPSDFVKKLKNRLNSCVLLKMFKLEYEPGAVPGKAIKCKISEEEVRNRQSMYEAKRN